MDGLPMLRQLLRDESITRGLGDIEAKLLIQWAADWAELLIDALHDEDEAWRQVRRVCVRARAIGKFVWLWNDPGSRGAALQLAATQRFRWPLPTRSVDGADLLEGILAWEGRHLVG